MKTRDKTSEGTSKEIVMSNEYKKKCPWWMVCLGIRVMVKVVEVLVSWFLVA